MNIDKYLEKEVQTENGTIYKNKVTFLGDSDKICYIPEQGLNILKECKKRGEDLDDKAIIDKNIGYSRNMIRNEIITFFGCNNRDIDKYHLDNIAFDYLDWQGVGAVLFDLTEEFRNILNK